MDGFFEKVKYADFRDGGQGKGNATDITQLI